jgi:50S ribosomal protein L16 3-hydroxylase
MGLQLGVDREHFAAAYWHRQPLLMRQALDPAFLRVSPDELAGLACEAEVESRIVIQHGPTEWQLEHGPFDEADFASLPESHWTLLVQDVDKLRPDVAELLDQFDFLPGWRIDDIMISYATDNGGVGPHRDAYDVFLIQGPGQRRWRLGAGSPGQGDLLPDQPLRILASFDTRHDWILEPGDVLYLPPGVAHWGTAIGDCMTYSVGFRATNQRELATAWYQHLVALAADTPIGDSADALVAPGRLDDQVVDEARRLIAALSRVGGDDFGRWLGAFLTEPKPQFLIERPDEAYDDTRLAAALHANALLRHPWLRVVWRRLADGTVCLFGNGESRVYAGEHEPLIRYLCDHRRLTVAEIDRFDADRSRPVLRDLLNIGWLEPDSPS